jgi:hypothetical protein
VFLATSALIIFLEISAEQLYPALSRPAISVDFPEPGPPVLYTFCYAVPYLLTVLQEHQSYPFISG